MYVCTMDILHLGPFLPRLTLNSVQLTLRLFLILKIRILLVGISDTRVDTNIIPSFSLPLVNNKDRTTSYVDL